MADEALEVMVKDMQGVVTPNIQKLLFKPMTLEDIREVLEECYK